MSIITTSTTSQNELISLRAAIAAQTAAPTGTITLLDRLAMRVGLSLILWSRGRAVVEGSSRVSNDGVRDGRSMRPTRQQRPFC